MRKISILVFTLLAFSFAPSVLAENDNPSTIPNPRQEERKANIEERKIERQNNLTAIRKERIIKFSNNMILRLEATVERIQKLIDRIELRIAKIKEDNEDINTTTLTESLKAAEEALELVKIDIAAFKASLAVMPDSEDPKADFEKSKESLKSIKEDLKDVHAMLVELIGDIKGLRVGNSTNNE